MSVDLDVTITSDEGVNPFVVVVVVLDVIAGVESRNIDIDLDVLTSAIISRALNLVVVAVAVDVVFRVVDVTVVEEVERGARGLRAGALAT